MPGQLVCDDDRMTSWPDFLSNLYRIEREWMGRGVDSSRLYLPWMPYSISRFVMYLTDAMGVAPGNMFLEVGCGPGSKCLLAEKLFGLDAAGFDRVQEYVDAAQANGVAAICVDAFDYPQYSAWDIVYVNKPCHGPLEAKLENLIFDQMKPGAVLILCNAATRPPVDWEPVAAEWDMNSGVWRKPS